jgi:D-glycero-D-manno-heptose 1,7-bisphosphate phosphatase
MNDIPTPHAEEPSTTAPSAGTQKAVFLDRDGTLIRDYAHGSDPTQTQPLPGVVEALDALQSAGYLLVVVTNQSGVARGFYSVAEAKAAGAHLAAVLKAAGVSLDGYYLSPYHRDGRIPRFSKDSEWRKPGPGMLAQAAQDLDIDLAASWTLGDNLSDVEAGMAAGGRGILVDTGALAYPQGQTLPATLTDPRIQVARNLPHAAALIVHAPAADAKDPQESESNHAQEFWSALPSESLIRPTRPSDDRDTGEPSAWPDTDWMIRAALDGVRLQAQKIGAGDSPMRSPTAE